MGEVTISVESEDVHLEKETWMDGYSLKLQQGDRVAIFHPGEQVLHIKHRDSPDVVCIDRGGESLINLPAGLPLNLKIAGIIYTIEHT